MNRRDLFIAAVQSRFGCFYRWDAKGPMQFDCSGLVTWGLAAVGALPSAVRFADNCKALWAQLPQPAKGPGAPLEWMLRHGDLCFYGPPDAPDHVMIWMGDGTVYGAAGGNSDTLTDEIARARNAFVQYRNQVSYRPDFIGYRMAPLD